MIQADMFHEPKQIVAPFLKGSAIFSREKTCRNEIRRWFVPEPKRWVAWLMVNPSNAGADKNDPTAQRVTHFTRSWGFDGWVGVNLYPFVEPDQKSMWKIADWNNAPHGPDWYARDDIHANANYIEKAGRAASLRMVAFGSQPVLRDDAWLEECLEAFGQPADIEGADENFYCLGTNKNGQPLHPMARGRWRIPNDQKPVLWRQS